MGDFKHIWVILAVLATAKENLAQNYRVCATISHTTNCQALEKDSSRVSCTFVTDNIDCALKIANATADFGVFSSEEVVLLAQQQPFVQRVVGSVKHQDRKLEYLAFEAVAVVKRDHPGGIEGLRNTGYCHPGFGVSDQKWSSRVLKYFEKSVARVNTNCIAGASPAENEVAAIAGFFKEACRPGPWSSDVQEDARLKSAYPQLCQLCNSNATDQTCQYDYQQLSVQVAGDTTSANSHLQALECLSRGYGNVSYVAWEHARQFLQGRVDVENYALLCENGSLVTFNSTSEFGHLAPCAWFKQPWSAVLAKTDVSDSLLSDLRTWLPNGRSVNTGTWTDQLDVIMFNEPSSVLDHATDSRILTEYVTDARPIPDLMDYYNPSTTPLCHTAVTWCTTSADETLKCSWVQRAAHTLGLEPVIMCSQNTSNLACMDSIQQGTSDFTSIDSNYGFLARQHYGLGAVLYHQTRRLESSRVVALVKESAIGTISRFENLRGKNACFPEYGGIAWVSFIRAAHERGVIGESECDYARAIGDFFESLCAPGAADNGHSLSESADVQKLCSLCRAPGTTSGINEQGIVTNTSDLVCAANYTNHFYGTNGTMACLAASDTDVAFIEQQYLANVMLELNLNASNFRALCRNNSLASSSGVGIDDGCALSVTVDGEIVARRNWQRTAVLASLMTTLDELFGYNAGTNKLIDLQIFSPFNNVANLLFKDSTIGLSNSNTTNDQVVNYIDLYRHLDTCTSAATSIGSGLFLATLAFVGQMFRMAAL